MSVSLWKWTEECDKRACCGDCDNCSYEDADIKSPFDKSVEWHIEHKKMGFADPIADVYELLMGKKG